MANHPDSKSGVPITLADTAAALKRMEEKLDAILQRLEWAPRTEADWYAEMYPKYSHPNLEKQSGGVNKPQTT